jgi:hypothetical protein
MNNPEGLPLLTCLKFKPTGLPWLIVEDTEYEREGALVLIFGEDWRAAKPGRAQCR